MTNTIPNVPRELLADLLGNDHDKRIMAERHLLAMLANAPSPAGVDGLAAVKVWEADADWDDHELVVRLSDAQAIIDGLRGEVERLTRESLHANPAYYLKLQMELDRRARWSAKACKVLELTQVSISLDDTEWGYSAPEKYKLLADIRAALSAGKEGE